MRPFSGINQRPFIPAHLLRSSEMSSLPYHIEWPDFAESVFREEDLLGISVEESNHDVFPEERSKNNVRERRERREAVSSKEARSIRGRSVEISPVSDVISKSDVEESVSSVKRATKRRKVSWLACRGEREGGLKEEVG